MPTRREFLSQTSIGGGALAFGGAAHLSSAGNKGIERPIKSLRVLILGGTGFIGPHFVHAALERGHKVTVFNRGKAQADLPAKVERLVGDRNGDLRSIQKREWDLALDLATYFPRWIRTLGSVLKQQVEHYTFISTIDVYKNPSANDCTDETSALLEFDGSRDPYTLDGGGGTYGPLKVLCEKEAENQFPGNTLIVRPGYMVGAGDPQERFTYWIARMKKGGEVLAPGNPLQPVQFIDVRDVAEWIIRMAERGRTGTYNTLGPGYSMTMCEMLGGIRGLFSVPTRLNWVAIPWIGRQDIVPPDALEWSIWRFSRDDAINSDKACAAGLTYRPLSTTALDTLRWYKAQPSERQSSVLTGSRIDENGTERRIDTPWSEIEGREREIIIRWQTHKARIM